MKTHERGFLPRLSPPSRKFTSGADPTGAFHTDHYLWHNQRRQEHLASLGLDLPGSSVLEVGAGIGDHTSFFLDRGCRVVSTDARPENLEILQRRYPDLPTRLLDLDRPPSADVEAFDIVYCYGFLYHLANPAAALLFMAGCAEKMLLLETCVSYGDEEAINECDEDSTTASQSVHGRGCRPTRSWVFSQLKALFPFVYLPATQPWHEEFPLDWTTPPTRQILTRSVFIAARQRIDNPLLLNELPMKQRRH